MSVGSGLAGYLGIGKETTWGTAVAPSRWREFTSESLEAKNKTIQSEGIDAGVLHERQDMEAANVTRDVSGDVEFDLPSKGLGLWVQAMISSWTAAAPVQISTSGVYTQVHKPDPTGSAESSLTIQKGVPGSDGNVVPFTYNGCVVTGWELGCKVGEFAHVKLSLDGQDERTPNSTPTAGLAAGTPSYPTLDGGFFQFAEGQLLAGATLLQTGGIWDVTDAANMSNVTEATIKYEIPRKTDRFFWNSAGLKAYQIQNGKRKGSGSLTQEFVGDAEYQKYMNATGFALIMRFVGPIIGTSGTNRATFEILLPSVKYDGKSPTVGGMDVIEVTRDFRWKQPASAAPPIQVKILSSDSAL